MIRRIHLFLILIFVFSALFFITAKAEEKEEVPPWLTVDSMEIIQIGNARYLLPKRTNIRKSGSLITFETPGMETIRIQNVRYLLPKGTKIRKRAGVITFEGSGEYTARRLLDFEERLQESEKEVERLKRVLGKKKTE